MTKEEIIHYQPDEKVRLDVRVEEETVWLNVNQMAELFGRDSKTIRKHVNNALCEELEGMSTVAKFATVQNEGGRMVERQIEFYSLDVIISVGYRVKSKRGIQFRQWANRILKEHLLRGYAVSLMEKRFEKLEAYIEEIISDQNEINEDTRMKIDSISQALAELQVKEQVKPERKPIGFTAYKKENQ